MAFDYSRLRGKIKEKFKTQADFAKALSCSSATVSGKLNNSLDFTQNEIAKAAEILGLSQEEIPSYFFAEIVQKL